MVFPARQRQSSTAGFWLLAQNGNGVGVGVGEGFKLGAELPTKTVELLTSEEIEVFEEIELAETTGKFGYSLFRFVSPFPVSSSSKD